MGAISARFVLITQPLNLLIPHHPLNLILRPRNQQHALVQQFRRDIQNPRLDSLWQSTMGLASYLRCSFPGVLNPGGSRGNMAHEDAAQCEDATHSRHYHSDSTRIEFRLTRNKAFRQTILYVALQKRLQYCALTVGILYTFIPDLI
jgi:hypothetical protein